MASVRLPMGIMAWWSPATVIHLTRAIAFATVLVATASEVKSQAPDVLQEWKTKVGQKYGQPKAVSKPFGGQPVRLGTTFNVGEDFGKYAPWDRQDKEVTFVVLINTADPLGVAICNLKRGDEIEVSSASGIGSFSRGNGKLVSSIIGIAAMVGGALAPGAAPFIAAGEEFATNEFGQPSMGERRDAYGQDPGNGNWCQDEGGVIICLPGSRGPYNQAGGGTKKKEPRYDHNRPNHVVPNGFFPVRDVAGAREHNTRSIDHDGELFVVAWDSVFEDNLGYYLVFIKVTRGPIFKYRDTTPVQLWNHLPGENQRFVIEGDLRDDMAKPIKVAFSNSCLDATSQAINQNGCQIQTYKYAETANQKWILEPVDNTWFRVRSAQNGKVLDADATNIQNGCKIQLWDWNGGEQQLWKFTPNGDDTYRIINKHQAERCLDVKVM